MSCLDTEWHQTTPFRCYDDPVLIPFRAHVREGFSMAPIARHGCTVKILRLGTIVRSCSCCRGIDRNQRVKNK
jgi:hypothetical protein